MTAKTMRMSRNEKNWILYDWANSVYATIIMTAIFPIYFTNAANSSGQSGDYWWSIATSVAMAVVAISAPLIGAFADFRGYKKKLFTFFFVIGLLFTLLTAFTDNWILLLLGYAISHVGFSGSCLVYDSFLPDITTNDRMDKVSSYGFAFGYIGGSTIPFLISIALITFGEKIGIDSVMAVKISIIITVLWWGLFTLPFLKNVTQKHGIEKPKTNPVQETFLGIGKTLENIFKNKKIFYFILAYFFYIDGVGTIISMSTSYGTALGLDSTGMILALLVTQLVAFPFSILFSILSKKFGSLKILICAVFLYLCICILGFIMGFGIEEGFLSLAEALILFWILAVLVGTVQGGIQAISRSYYGKLVPPDNAGEYFGFFDIFGKFAAVLGPALYALTIDLTGRSSFAILSIILLFVMALLILLIGRKHLMK